jgi:hypothetical protein
MRYNQISDQYTCLNKGGFTQFEDTIVTNKKCGEGWVDQYFDYNNNTFMINNIYNYVYPAWVYKQSKYFDTVIRSSMCNVITNKITTMDNKHLFLDNKFTNNIIGLCEQSTNFC